MSKKALLPVLILAVLLLIAWIIRANPPTPPRSGGLQAAQLTVGVMSVQPKDYQIEIASYGVIRAQIQTLLVSQVSGEITSVADKFDEGGYFKAGDVLLQLDPRDNQADVAIAAAALADAEQALAEEQARVEQARLDWARLGNEGEAPALVLRQPQLAAASARVASAEAGLTKARLDLERTTIRAPYEGRVLRQLVNLGQVVNLNTQLAEVFATEIAEVRLPIANNDLPFVDLPDDSPGQKNEIQASIQSELLAGAPWSATVVRTEGAIDETARQLHVLAHIKRPFDAAIGRAPLKLGEYVTATIQGKMIKDALAIPMSTIYQGAFVYVVEEGAIQRRSVEIAWSNGETALISAGLAQDELLVTTNLGQVTSGTRVKLESDTIQPDERSPNGRSGQGPADPSGQRPADRSGGPASEAPNS